MASETKETKETKTDIASLMASDPFALSRADITDIVEAFRKSRYLFNNPKPKTDKPKATKTPKPSKPKGKVVTGLDAIIDL